MAARERWPRHRGQHARQALGRGAGGGPEQAWRSVLLPVWSHDHCYWLGSHAAKRRPICPPSRMAGRGRTPPHAHLLGPEGAHRASPRRLARPAWYLPCARPCTSACFSAAQSLVHAAARRGTFGARGGALAEGMGRRRAGDVRGGHAAGLRAVGGMCGQRSGRRCIPPRPRGRGVRSREQCQK